MIATMNKKFLQQLVLASYTKDGLDAAKAHKIASFLRRGELKQYIRTLKMNEQRNSIVVTTARPMPKNDEEAFKKVYPDKKILTHTDPSLLLGLRIQDNDIIYEMNLKDTLDNMSEYIEE